MKEIFGMGTSAADHDVDTDSTRTGNSDTDLLVKAVSGDSVDRDGGAHQPRSIAIRLSTVVVASVIAALVAGICTLAVLYTGVKGDLADRDSRTADAGRAQEVATDYAVGASTIDYRDTKTWFDELKANTTPQLAAKFDATSPQLEQILLPLQWTSKAAPITAVVISEANGVYKVNVFLNVTSTSVQTPDGVQTTVTYSLTVDRNADWKITDVGGLDGALPVK
ncbi:hypothetical protein AB0H49_22620 [Nocardia sp. NPDC050713]|uniref:hypothetical protein n=1 Tax=Nocardia sp. NPDC050713 TaxID=3154511 RepID=UPI0033D10391